MKKNILYTFSILITTLLIFAFTLNTESFAVKQKECPPEGKAKKGKPALTEEKKEFNRKKNKSSKEPSNSNPKIYSINDLLQGTKPVADENHFTEGTYVEISDAYLMTFEEQGPEDCNCHYGNKKKHTGDVHINLCNESNLKAANNNYTMIVEITPSYKALHPKYATELKALKGKKVTVRGYLFYDEHQGNSINYCKVCSDRGVWRKTCWEIHPVTFIGVGG